MFEQKAHVCHNTFKFLCERLGLYLYAQMKKTISFEDRIAIWIQRLEIENTLCMIEEAYGVAESKISKIMKKFCRSIRIYLQWTFVSFPSATRFRTLGNEFEPIHAIPRIIGILIDLKFQISIYY